MKYLLPLVLFLSVSGAAMAGTTAEATVENLHAHLLEGQGVKLSAIELGHLAYPDSPVAEHVAITQGKFGELTPVAEIGQLSKGWLASKRVVVVNADHPTVVHLLQIATREPEFAAYLLLKLFYLRSELPAELDGALATAAAEARWQRSTS